MTLPVFPCVCCMRTNFMPISYRYRRYAVGTDVSVPKCENSLSCSVRYWVKRKYIVAAKVFVPLVDIGHVIVSWACGWPRTWKITPETIGMLKIAFKVSTISITPFYEWFTVFNEAKIWIDDQPRSGHLSIYRVEEILFVHRRMIQDHYICHDIMRPLNHITFMLVEDDNVVSSKKKLLRVLR